MIYSSTEIIITIVQVQCVYTLAIPEVGGGGVCTPPIFNLKNIEKKRNSARTEEERSIYVTMYLHVYLIIGYYVNEYTFIVKFSKVSSH